MPLDPQDATPMVQVERLSKIYAAARGSVELFRDLSFSVAAGEFLAIVGESGAGKSSLLHLLAAMDTPTAGTVHVGGTDLGRLTPRQQAEFRNREIGYVWQFHYLLPEFTAAENVAMPLLARGMKKPEAMARAARWLAEVELADRLEHRSGELSGGEQQRVSLARALVGEPKLLLADEPTGDLDNRTAEVVFGLLQRLHRTHRLTSVLVTHHLGFAARCDRTLQLREGALQDVDLARPAVS
jgi:lipoprotein-releasing system ATP-binding protein